MTPEAIGEAIGDVYTEAIEALVPLIQAKPVDGEAIQALHAACVRRLVKLGAEREALSEEAQAVVDDVASERIFALDSELHDAFLEEQSELEDEGLKRLVMSFGIITQYAFYELLRRQRPDEALRLGLT